MAIFSRLGVPIPRISYQAIHDLRRSAESVADHKQRGVGFSRSVSLKSTLNSVTSPRITQGDDTIED